MIVIAREFGRLANRLLLFAHFIAAAVEHGLVVLNPAFRPYAQHFPSTARDLLCRFPPGPSVRPPPGGRYLLHHLTRVAAYGLHRLQEASWDVGLIRLRGDQWLDLDSPVFLAAARRHRLLFVQGWHFRTPQGCERYADVIRAFFTPSDHHLARVRRTLEPLRRRNRFVIGVHVRRTDYGRFRRGRYYYTNEQFRALMVSAEAAFPSENVSFLVCSDEPLAADAFPDLDVAVGPGSAIEDLYSLAACDRLLGPPSTYSSWASFYGKVPHYQVEDPAIRVETTSFRANRGVSPRPATKSAWARPGPGGPP